MKTVRFKQDCNFKGITYYVGEELKDIKEQDLADIWKLNEKGLIEPLTARELKGLIEKPNLVKKYKNEEE